ncbi:hypothetical protein [Maridesulfovibrio sp.]|uniref:hypothetical protein n=1 Tax=Maridesulfovibrio sp. TaxID=2795000 RepID=UPI003BAC2140
MIMDTATIIIFAIRASIKIGDAGYKSYVDITRNRELVLPLPDLPTEMTKADAWLFFYENDKCPGAKFARKIEGSDIKPWPRVVRLDKELTDMSDAEKKELVALAIQAQNQLMLWAGSQTGKEYDPSTRESTAALYTVQGWEDGTSVATSLQRVAGSLIEVGIDFLQLNPKLFNTNTTEGKLIKHFINELDEIEFSTNSLDNLPIILFTATLDTVGANPQIFGNNTNVHLLIGNSAKKVATLVNAKNNAINQSSKTETIKRKERFEMEAWGELIFRGILDAAGHTAISDPGSFLGIQGEGSQLLARKVGEDVLDLMIGNDTIKFKPIFSQSGAERLTKTALEVVSKHPKLITQTDDKINGLLSEIAKGIAGTNMPLFDDTMLPEVARIVLEKTGENLDLVWPEAQNKPETNILFIATKATLEALSNTDTGLAPENTSPYWRPDFTHTEMLMVVETICDEIKKNPSWIFAWTSDNSKNPDNKYYEKALAIALDQTIACLKSRKAEISAETSAQIIAEVIKGIALRQELLTETIFEDQSHKNIAAAAIDAILSSIFDCPDDLVKWRLCRDEILQEIVAILIAELTESNAAPKAVDALNEILTDFITEIKDGGKIDLVKLKKDANQKLQDIT